MNPKFVRNFLIVRSLSDWLNYIKIYPDIFCIQILLYGVYPVAWNLSGHFLYSDFLFVQIPDIRKFRTAIFIIFWVKRQVYSGHIRQYPDIFDNIFRTLFFHRDGWVVNAGNCEDSSTIRCSGYPDGCNSPDCAKFDSGYHLCDCDGSCQ